MLQIKKGWPCGHPFFFHEKPGDFDANGTNHVRIPKQPRTA